MTPFKAIAQACGLTLKQTAAFTGIPVSSTQSYWAGKRTTPPEWSLLKLHKLSSAIQSLAAQYIEAINSIAPYSGPEAIPKAIRLKILSKPKQLKDAGLPYAGCHEHVISLIIAGMPAAYLDAVELLYEADEDLKII